MTIKHSFANFSVLTVPLFGISYRPKTTLLYKWGIIAYIEKNVHEDMQCCLTYLSKDLLILSSAQYCMIPPDILVG